MSSIYLTSILFSIAGLLIADHKYKLAVFKSPRRTFITIAPVYLVFVLWDLIGINLGIFFTGDSTITSGIHVTRELPIEELFFLLLLCYVSLILWTLGKKRWPLI